MNIVDEITSAVANEHIIDIDDILQQRQPTRIQFSLDNEPTLPTDNATLQRMATNCIPPIAHGRNAQSSLQQMLPSQTHQLPQQLQLQQQQPSLQQQQPSLQQQQPSLQQQQPSLQQQQPSLQQQQPLQQQLPLQQQPPLQQQQQQSNLNDTAAVNTLNLFGCSLPVSTAYFTVVLVLIAVAMYFFLHKKNASQQ